MKRFLLYTVAMGERYRAFASMLANSVFMIGKWRHDMVVLSDRDSLVGSPPGLRVIDTTKNVSTPVQRGAIYAKRAKTAIQYHVDFKDYNYIVFLDSDMLVNTSRLHDLVCRAESSGHICVMKDWPNWTVGLGHRLTGRYVLTAQEREKWADVSINAGVVGFPGNDLGLDFLRRWETMNIVGSERRFSDNASLYAIILRHFGGRWQHIGDTAPVSKLKRYSETLLHFAARKDDLMESYYSEILGLPLLEIVRS
jgi:hypothetical protein